MFRSRLPLLAGLVLVALLACAPAAQADSWPRFRGPNGQGIAEKQNIPAKWNKENILWKAALPGDGNSSPVVWDDHLFIQSASKDGKQRFLVCLNAKTGEKRWTKTVGGHKETIHKKNSFASSTPATDGERVYVCFWDGTDVIMTAFDFGGRQAWSRNLGPFTSQHGAGASPIVHENKVILLNDQDGKAVLIALDARSGEKIWESPRPAYRACYGAPFVWERTGGAKEVVVVSTLQITGYDPDTGKDNWSWDWKHKTKMPLRVTASPVFAGDRIFACSGDGGGDRGMVALDVHANGKGAATKLAWGNKKDFPYVPSPLFYQDHLYFVNDAGWAGCFDPKSGQKIWMKRLTESSFTSSPVLIDGKMYAADEAVRATPAVANQRLYIRGKDHLFCIGQAQ